MSFSCHVGDGTEMGKQRAKSRVKGASRVNGPSKPPTAKNLAAQFKIPALEKVSGEGVAGGCVWTSVASLVVVLLAWRSLIVLE